MSSIDLFTFCAFACALLLGIMALVLQDMRNQRPDARIRARIQKAFPSDGTRFLDTRHDHSDLYTLSRHDNAISLWFAPRIARLKTVAGANGMRVVIGAAIAGEIIALVIARFVPLPSIATPLLLIGMPVLAVMQAYRFLIERFKRRFLDGFPDLIDLIVRAVRAGVPVTHVIGSAAEECPEPLRSEFKLMGDALKVGLDLGEVLDVAVARIGIADFSFFCVCLLLQRETGGQLGETLENLAGIVRRRREIRQKTRALTGEARITTKILASVPFVILGSMYLLNKAYLMVLFDTPTGQKVLACAAVTLVMGLSVVHKMSKLDTSR
ncbi:type II secretion system F family protein [Caballeronia concitans]|uniref:Type II secretion system protein n=1 Tax=Caballeronia concitans TaxID=1777133 RepID=A0A658R2A8_9BURK|nr:type II secretion system F family protein [Caballeronia concitans]KIG08679.1 Type II secretion system F domain-containing protein [Burkholderia sp. MR1]SAL40796.1 type II secretion system protein [Caballeronia concitans]